MYMDTYLHANLQICMLSYVQKYKYLHTYIHSCIQAYSYQKVIEMSSYSCRKALSAY